MKERSPENTSVCISLDKALLAEIDKRAKSHGLPRSRYLALIARHAVTAKGGAPLPTPAAPESPQPLDLTAAVYDFLLLAIPALADFESRKQAEQVLGTAPEPPEEIAESRLWRFFLLERDEILRHKYLRSEALREDIGLQRAIKEWLQLHRALWAAAHPPAD
ncbi:MAG: hypothetical protein NTX51_15255 [Verrucomicrobia bacterium]|nr:hypothetical protein [Verrucomicrobiota bacterium]